MNTLNEKRRRFQSGALSRHDFWVQMQAAHLQLRDHQALIAGSDIEALELRAEELVVRTKDGVSMVWSPEDLGSAPNVLVNYGCYERLEADLLLRAARNALVVFDVGANVGFYSLRWSRFMAPGGIVHAFEPVPDTFRALARNVQLNSMDRSIKTHDFGLAERVGLVEFFVPGFSGSGAASMRNLHPEQLSNRVQAKLDTLDRFFPTTGLGRIDLMKVDVEGAELFVLQGGAKTIEQHLPLMFLELLRKWSRSFGYHPNDVISMLAKFGYECFAADGGSIRKCETVTDETVQTNFFFAHPVKHAAWIATCST